MRAHELQPWSELADSRAKWAAAHYSRLPSSSPVELLALRSTVGDITVAAAPWLFLAFALAVARESYPVSDGDSFVVMMSCPSGTPHDVLRPSVLRKPIRTAL